MDVGFNVCKEHHQYSHFYIYHLVSRCCFLIKEVIQAAIRNGLQRGIAPGSILHSIQLVNDILL